MGLITDWVFRARTGTLPSAVCRTPSGWVVMGEAQVVRGYCLLLPDPVVPSLNDLSGAARASFLTEMALLGDAVLEVTKARRINYEILGNQEPELHAHVFPRYHDEPDEHRLRPIWFYDWERAPRFSPPLHGDLARRIGEAVVALIGTE